jgi:hypothetical protein
MNKSENIQGKQKHWSKKTDQGKWRSNKLLKNIVLLQQFKETTGKANGIVDHCFRGNDHWKLHNSPTSHYSEYQCCIVEGILRTCSDFHAPPTPWICTERVEPGFCSSAKLNYSSFRSAPPTPWSWSVRCSSIRSGSSAAELEWIRTGPN